MAMNNDIVIFPENEHISLHELSTAEQKEQFGQYHHLLVKINTQEVVAATRGDDLEKLEMAFAQAFGLTENAMGHYMTRYGPNVDLGEGKAKVQTMKKLGDDVDYLALGIGGVAIGIFSDAEHAKRTIQKFCETLGTAAADNVRGILSGLHTEIKSAYDVTTQKLDEAKVAAAIDAALDQLGAIKMGTVQGPLAILAGAQAAITFDEKAPVKGRGKSAG